MKQKEELLRKRFGILYMVVQKECVLLVVHPKPRQPAPGSSHPGHIVCSVPRSFLVARRHRDVDDGRLAPLALASSHSEHNLIGSQKRHRKGWVVPGRCSSVRAIRVSVLAEMRLKSVLAGRNADRWTTHRTTRGHRSLCVQAPTLDRPRYPQSTPPGVRPRLPR